MHVTGMALPRSLCCHGVQPTTAQPVCLELHACVLCSGVANCPELGLVMIAFLIIFSQFLRGVGLPKRIPVIGG